MSLHQVSRIALEEADSVAVSFADFGGVEGGVKEASVKEKSEGEQMQRRRGVGRSSALTAICRCGKTRNNSRRVRRAVKSADKFECIRPESVECIKVTFSREQRKRERSRSVSSSSAVSFLGGGPKFLYSPGSTLNWVISSVVSNGFLETCEKIRNARERTRETSDRVEHCRGRSTTHPTRKRFDLPCT